VSGPERTESNPPVVAVDGPNASGKGTVSQSLARRLGWHLLDSGAMYRIVALASLRRGIAVEDIPALAALAAGLVVDFAAGEEEEPARVLLGREDVTGALRTEECGERASRVAVHPAVRTALL